MVCTFFCEASLAGLKCQGDPGSKKKQPKTHYIACDQCNEWFSVTEALLKKNKNVEDSWCCESIPNLSCGFEEGQK